MHTPFRYTAIFAALLAAGCASVGPDYKAPVEKPVALIGADAKAQAPEPVPSQWWSQFGDTTLDALIDKAAKNAPDLAIAGARLREARALLGTAKSAQIPEIGRAHV